MELLIELGFPELPSTVIVDAERELGLLLSAAIEGAGLAAEPLTALTFSTPRRLAVRLGPIRARQDDRRESVRGPAWAAAFREDGTPTRAAEGFARGQGVAVSALRREETPQGPYAYADREIPGRSAQEVLREIVPDAAGKLRFPRTMRWAEGAPRFPRPLAWLLAVLDGEVLDTAIGPVRAGSRTYGHRVLAPGPFPVETPSSYLDVLRAAHVLADRAERRRHIAADVRRAAAERDLTAEMPEGLLDEVTDLCEWPDAFLGDFDQAFLEVPALVLRATMVHHQRFFPVSHAGGAMAPHFVAVRNGGDPDVVRRGNQTVLRARLADALFFFREDRRQPLASRREALGGIAYAPKLGSLLERSARLGRLAQWLAQLSGAEEPGAMLRRAGELALCDRATAVVRELPELEGEMGAEYLRLDGEDPGVCAAVGGRVRPRGADDDIAPGRGGQILALADRLDHLLGFIATGRAPTGSQDPFGLRRAAIGALRLFEALQGVPFEAALQAAAEGYRELLGDAALEAIPAVASFLAGRLQARLVDEGGDPRQVQAVLAAGLDPATARARLEALREAAGSAEFARLVQAARRAGNLAQAGDVAGAEGEERELLGAIERLEQDAERLLADGDHLGYLRRAGALWEPLDRFFAAVLVMDQDRAVQARRRAILHRAQHALTRVADIAELGAE